MCKRKIRFNNIYSFLSILFATGQKIFKKGKIQFYTFIEFVLKFTIVSFDMSRIAANEIESKYICFINIKNTRYARIWIFFSLKSVL